MSAHSGSITDTANGCTAGVQAWQCLHRHTALAWDVNINTAELWHIFKISRTQIYEHCVVFLWLAAAYLAMYLHLTMRISTNTLFSLRSSSAELEALAVSTFLLPFPSQHSGLHSALTFYIPTSNFTTTFHIAMTFQNNMNISLYKTNCPNINIHLQKYFMVHCRSICANMASNFSP
jgi:hypothetical protein